MENVPLNVWGIAFFLSYFIVGAVLGVLIVSAGAKRTPSPAARVFAIFIIVFLVWPLVFYLTSSGKRS